MILRSLLIAATAYVCVHVFGCFHTHASASQFYRKIHTHVYECIYIHCQQNIAPRRLKQRWNTNVQVGEDAWNAL